VNVLILYVFFVEGGSRISSLRTTNATIS